MVVDGTLQPASQPLEGLVSSDNLGSTQQCFGSHFIALVSVKGHTYLCDVGAGPKGLAEPLLLRAYDDTDSSSSSPTQQLPPADWLNQQGESQQYGLRYRLRRGIMGSAEPLSAPAALTHPERDSFVGYYLQVRQAPTQCDCVQAWRVRVCTALSPQQRLNRLSLQCICCCCLAARAESFSQRRCYTPDAPSMLPSPLATPKQTCSTLSRAHGGTCTGSIWRR